jgi:precorrin-6A/cobalt-precorrin-6A reductase
MMRRPWNSRLYVTVRSEERKILLDRSLPLIVEPANPQIWLIGGTQESAELARSLAAHQIPGLISMTTEAARSLYPDSSYLRIWVGRLQADAVPAFVQAHHIVAILDASHPFAVEISRLAIAVAAQLNVPYLRFERSGVEAGGRRQAAGKNFVFPTFQDLFATNVIVGQRVLLTVGYRPLPLFQPWQTRATLFARLLPSTTALQTAIAAGFTPDRLIALRPPISMALEQALWQQWQISMVVTKASGVAGGEDVKRQVAMTLGVALVTIARPEMAYPQQTDDVAIAIAFCQQIFDRQ